MAKQSNKSARADSSAGRSAAAVSTDTDAAAAAAPKPALVKTADAQAAPAPSAEASVEAQDRGALLSVVESMYGAVPDINAYRQNFSLTSEPISWSFDHGHCRASPFAIWKSADRRRARQQRIRLGGATQPQPYGYRPRLGRQLTRRLGGSNEGARPTARETP
jgi:hypothetical protein